MNKLVLALLLSMGVGSQAHAKDVVIGTYSLAPNECYTVTKTAGDHTAKRADCTARTQPATVLSRTRYSVPRDDGAYIIGTRVLMIAPTHGAIDVDIPLFAGM